MSREHFFCTWGCQKGARTNPQDHSGRKSIPDDASMTGLKAPEHNWLQAKRLRNYQEFLKFAPGAQQIYQGTCESMTVLRFLKKVFQPSIKDVFHNH